MARLQALREVLLRHRYDTAFILGGFLTLALPPLGLFPVLFLVIPLQMWLTASAGSGRSAFLTGWAFGGGYFILGLYWLGIAFAEMYDRMPWFLPFVFFGIPLYIALHYALASLAAYYFRKLRVVYALAYTVFFFWAEYLRGHFPGNFPWNTIGSVWYHVLPLLQSLALYGVYGLTFMTLLWAAALFLLIGQKNKNPAERAFVAFAAISFIVVLGWGAIRMTQFPTLFRSGIAVQIVQPNVTREEKIISDYEDKNDSFERHLALMRQYPAPASPVMLSIWPEAVFNISSGEEKTFFSRIAKELPEGGYAAVGAHRIVTRNARRDIYNSILILDKSAAVLATYDKTALTPWGEYVPLDGFIQRTPLAKYLGEVLRLRAGTGPQTFRVGNLPSFSPVICFESVFSGGVVPRNDRPDFLLSVANDAWSSGSVGPFQSFGFMRLRAIEEGLPVMRAANIGISAVIDPYGRELHRLDMHETGVINSRLPEAASPTVFSRYGEEPLSAGVCVLTVIMLFLGYRRKRKKRD